MSKSVANSRAMLERVSCSFRLHMRLPPSTRAYITHGALIGVVWSASACRGWVTEQAVPEQAIAAGEPGPVRVTKADGTIAVLMHPVVANDSLMGMTQGLAPQRIAIPITEVRSVERRRLSLSRSAELVRGYEYVATSVGILVIAVLLLKY